MEKGDLFIHEGESYIVMKVKPEYSGGSTCFIRTNGFGQQSSGKLKKEEVADRIIAVATKTGNWHNFDIPREKKR